MKRWQSSTDHHRSNPVGTSPSCIIGIRIPDFGTNNPHGLVPLTIIHQQSFKGHKGKGSKTAKFVQWYIQPRLVESFLGAYVVHFCKEMKDESFRPFRLQKY